MVFKVVFGVTLGLVFRLVFGVVFRVVFGVVFRMVLVSAAIIGVITCVI